ncbi:uncharacterized protein MELLADRAFT_65701 [Melampsora larici-populina 98AG31]|uniref:FAD-binding FR-type domain-containing protein n=1 Tax=Melampsora larici-populina (strain 98AG31 / pathotype 3-4-7) TaxID=747676 RepID=F4RWE2_MELLP|nr:uncharacterized protein MELLADRAFT_65701 [Melampsora larici-populina 98AG31]EGG03336.1 hypothetical protein MELLADRAFT_65701 [Melampsora larici-populina 98AG31]
MTSVLERVQINFLHKFVGRVVTAAVTVHGGLFLKMYLDGVIKISLAMYIGGGMWIALKRFYGLFYWVHLLGYSGIFSAAMFHSPMLRPYIISAIVLHSASTAWQLFKANKMNATLTALPGKFVMLEIPGLKSGWKPADQPACTYRLDGVGQHIRIRMGNFSQILQAHPFTIATSSGNPLILYIKVSGRFTRTIYTHAERAQEAEELELKPSNHSDVATLQGNETTQTEGDDASEKRSSLPSTNSSTIRLLVQGPYGGMGPHSMKDFGSVFLCVGGSGISYLTSTIMDIVTEKMNGRCSTKRIKALYVLQEWDAAQYFGKLLGIQMERAEMCGIDFELQIFVTKQEYSRYSQRTLDGIQVSWSRPKVNDLFREFLKTVTGGWGVGCGVCGPRSLSADLRKAVGGVSVGDAKRLGGITFYS